MNTYIEFLTRIFEMYNRKKETNEWEEELNRVNENTCIGENYRFNPNLPPFFYSGKLVNTEGNQMTLNEPNCIFITLNPQENAQVKDWQPGEVKIEDFIKRMNNWFISTEATDRKPTSIYLNCDRFLCSLMNIDRKNGDGYGNLHRYYGCVVDWFPYYSTNFCLSIENNLPKQYLTTILNGLSELKCPKIVAGRDGTEEILKMINQDQIEVLDDYVNACHYNGKQFYTVRRLSQQGCSQKIIDNAAKTIQKHFSKT